MQRVTCLIDINAPCQDVFNTVVNLERRMQLSPLWGLNRVSNVAPNFPEPGSSYRMRVMTNKPFGLAQGTLNAQQNALAGFSQALFFKLDHTAAEDLQVVDSTSDETPAEENQSQEESSVEQEYIVDEYQPPHKFSYYLDEDCDTFVTWSFQSIPFGTRVNYEEVFCDENVGDEDFVPTVQNVVREWLSNLKRYSELHGSRGRRAIKWFLDRFYLKLRPDQRRVVLMLLYLQALGLGTFVVAAVSWGLVSIFL